MKRFAFLLVFIFSLLQCSSAWAEPETFFMAARKNKQVDRLPAPPKYTKKKTTAAPKEAPKKEEPQKKVTPKKEAIKKKAKPAATLQQEPKIETIQKVEPKIEPKRELRQKPKPRIQKPVAPYKPQPVQRAKSRRNGDDPHGLYIGGHLGGNIRPEAKSSGAPFDFDPGFLGGLAVGYEFSGPLRLEAEIAYRSNDANDTSGAEWSASTLSYMGNAYFDYRITPLLRPYFGLGAGMGHAKLVLEIPAFFGVSRSQDTDFVFAYQALLGLGLDLSDNFTLNVGYRYFATSDPGYSLSGFTVITEIESHEFLVGGRIRF